MFEMIYGNTGKRDEAVNINMDDSLFRKLSGRTFVPKLKSLLNDNHQQGDKCFVYIGCVADKSENFTVYGYNAKLAVSDSRGGDYGHYIAFPMKEKVVDVDLCKAMFFTEDGFVEFVNQQVNNDSKKFGISPEFVECNDAAKKRIVNNLMETFMKVRKRKVVNFCFEETTVDEFNSKSVYLLLDIMKYLPYSMRKLVVFMSHVCSGQRVEMVNLMAYPSAFDGKPHDCIDISDNVSGNDGVFNAYVERVFAMSDGEREEYFEKLYNEIEVPAIKAGVNVRSDIYLLDVETRKLWETGDADETVSNIFASVNDILKLYPEYLEIAKKRLSVEGEAVSSYIRAQTLMAMSVEELKPIYLNMIDLSETCGIGIEDEVVEVMKNRTSNFIDEINDDELLLAVCEGAVDINPAVLDSEAVKNAVNRIMGAKNNLNGIYNLYKAVEPKNYMDSCELAICFTENADNFIIKATDVYSEAKDKLSALKNLYVEFQAYCPDMEYPLMEQVYERYVAVFSGNASSEAVAKGSAIIDEVDRLIGTSCNIYDIKESVVKISGIDVAYDAGIKARTADCFRRITDRMYNCLDMYDVDCSDFARFISDVTPAVTLLNNNGVYDRPVQSVGYGSSLALDGMLRLVTVFGNLIEGMNNSVSLADTLQAFQNAVMYIEREENLLEIAFGKYGCKLLKIWCEKNPKVCTKGQLKKAIQSLEKKRGISLSQYTVNVFEKIIGGMDAPNKKAPVVIAAIVVAIVILGVGVLGAAGFGAYWFFFREEPVEIVEVEPVDEYIEQKTIDEIEEYISSFNDEENENLGDTFLAFGSFEESLSGVILYRINIEHPFDADSGDEKTGSFVGNYTPHKNSKNYCIVGNMDDAKGKKYIMVLQRQTEDEKFDYYIHDVYEVPVDLLDNYLISAAQVSDLYDYSNYIEFADKLVEYVGYKEGILEIKPEEPIGNDKEPVDKDEEPKGGKL